MKKHCLKESDVSGVRRFGVAVGARDVVKATARKYGAT